MPDHTSKGSEDSNTIIVWVFNTPFSSMDRPSRQKINKETFELNHIIEQMQLADVYRTFHPTAEEYTILLISIWKLLQDRLYVGSQIKFQYIFKA
jgi:hypothetical protein